MTSTITPDNLHRTAKYFMDSGRAANPDEAVALLNTFGLTVSVGDEVATSSLHQIALLTLVNTARRTFLAGIEVIGVPDCLTLVPLAASERLMDAVRELGGKIVDVARADWPCAVIGAGLSVGVKPAWQLTWQAWSGGIYPAARSRRLDEANAMSLAPAVAAGVCVAEAFAYHAGDHSMAGKRELGLSLWDPGNNWLATEGAPELKYLPSKLWMIGLGNLGQAMAWLLATLPYCDFGEVELVLQDFDRIAASNDSTSLLSFLRDVGTRKTRVVAAWLDRVGFTTILEERRFGSWIKRTEQEPAVAFCGVDNGETRLTLEDAGFDLIVETGLGAGPEAFRSIALHTFPATRKASAIWSSVTAEKSALEELPAYQALKNAGVDECGLAQLASRTVGVPFVGLLAGCLALSELLRRLNGGKALEFAAGSALTLNLEAGVIEAPIYAYGHLEV